MSARVNAAAAALVALAMLATAAAASAHEPYADAGERVCVLSPEQDSCRLGVQEDASTLALDVKCRPLADAMDRRGFYRRSDNHLLDNGRLRTKAGDQQACTLLMSDDLVQMPGEQNMFPECSDKNPNLYDSANNTHYDTVQRIEQNGQMCEIAFKPDATTDNLIAYVNNLRSKANAVIERRAIS